MLPGPEKFQVLFGVIVQTEVLPIIELTIFANGTHLDAYAAGGSVLLLEIDAATGASAFIDRHLRVFLFTYGLHWAGLDATLAADAEVLVHRFPGGYLGSGEHGDESHSRPIFLGQQHIIEAERPQSSKVGGVAMREEGVGIVKQQFHRPISITGNVGGSMSLFVQELGQLISPFVQLGIEVLV